MHGELSDPGAYCFGLRVETEHVVAHLAAPSRLLVASERQPCVEDVVAVDPHRPGAKLLRHAMRLAYLPRPDGGSESIVALVVAWNNLLGLRKWHRGHNHSHHF